MPIRLLKFFSEPVPVFVVVDKPNKMQNKEGYLSQKVGWNNPCNLASSNLRKPQRHPGLRLAGPTGKLDKMTYREILRTNPCPMN